MNRPPREKPRNTKRTGELAKAAFLHKAVGLGFRVTKPWGDSERYDFVLDSGRRLWRVQIKCTAVERAGGYHIQPIHFVYGKNKVVYTANDIDVLAAHVVPLDVWYVVPVAALAAGRVCGFIRMMGARRRGLRNIARGGICFVARVRRRRASVPLWRLARSYIWGMRRSLKALVNSVFLSGDRGFLGVRNDVLPPQKVGTKTIS